MALPALQNIDFNPIEALKPDTKRYFDIVKVAGKAAANALWPEDFESYLLSLELVDSNDSMVDFLTFPVMPDNISEDESNINNIKKTARGITSLSNSTFIPRNITISGTFGRKFRFLVGRSRILDFTGITASGSKQKVFSNTLKTGYGVTKALESILKKSRRLDNKGNPYRLYLYNAAFGTNYLVKYSTKNFNQSLDSNMIWNYSITFKAIAPLTALRSRKKIIQSLLVLTGKQMLSEGLNATARATRQFLRRNSPALKQTGRQVAQGTKRGVSNLFSGGGFRG